MTFLQEVACDIVKNWTDFKNICIICPNKRTIDYLKHNLAQKLQKPIWAPKFITLSELFAEYSDLKKTDQLILSIELFKVFSAEMKNTKYFKNINFEKFYGIGEILLNDFNEIDNYLLNVEKIFININNYQAIDYSEEYLTQEQKNTIKQFFGHFAETKLSHEKEYFLEIWQKIPQIYHKFTKNLKKKKLAYNGLITAEICENIKQNKITFSEYDKFIFVGFYALTKGQKYFCNEIQKQNKSIFYWDYDNFYTKNTLHEAGLFMRENLQKFSDNLKISRNKFTKNKKNISIIGFPLEISQTKAIPTLLNDLNINLKDKNQLTKTAIVLPNDKLLFPILHSIPNNIEQINVTLGFPFKNSSIYLFMKIWLSTIQKFISNEKIPTKNFLNLINSQIISEILNEKILTINEKIQNTKKTSISIEEITSLNNNFLSTLFNKENTKSINTLLENILLTLEKIFKITNNSNRTIETEAIYQFYKQILNLQKTLKKTLVENKNIITNKIFIKFLLHNLANTHIPFSGKSQSGLQIMTIMETRNIDFENIIILNVNEQILPKKNHKNSLISEFIRKSYGLPMLKYQDSIYAYLFYRLIQNSKNIILTYSNIISEKNGELSRFIQQLEIETNFITKKQQYTEKINPKLHKKITINKNDPEINSELEKYLQKKKSLSASAINLYLNCPLKFYFSKIAKIKTIEDEKTNAEIDPIKYGNIFHNSIEKLYIQHVGKTITKKNIEQIKLKIEKIVQEKISEELKIKTETIKSGLNNIIANVIKKQIVNLLNYDKINSPFELISIEKSKKYFGNFKFKTNEIEHEISVYSIFDRVDKKNDEIRIIDYKTGTEELSTFKMENIFDPATSSKYKGLFQMMTYSLVYQQNFPNKKFAPKLLVIREINENFSGNIKINKEEINSKSIQTLDNFKNQLAETLAEIFDKKTPFSQTKNTNNCKYCEYKEICGQ